MPAFFEYLRNITYYLMFATVIGIFAPMGKYRKFVSLVLGFVLLLMMIQPLAVVLKTQDIPVTQWFANFSPAGSFSGEALWDDHLRGAFEAQLEAQLTQLLNANGFVVHASSFGYSDDFAKLTYVNVDVSAEEFPSNERVPFIRIEPPQIRPIIIGTPHAEQAETNEAAEAVKSLISQYYNLPVTHIHVTMTNTKAR
ncbi:MAG: stage III sporulation protein AF [Defluviitaleaceae bacterium]|nr:stage III sporulation protein AF [Defluviitaleaceae bacterium]